MSQCICGHHGKFSYPLLPQSLCSKCFTLKFEKEVLKHIPRSIRGYPIAISLSGGKDSSTLLHILNKYQRKLRIPQLYAFVLEEGIPEIQDERQKVINEFKKSYSKIIFIEKSYFDLFGQTLPNLVQLSDNKGLRFTPCAICGILRRHAILRLSLKNPVNFVIMGTTLNDEAETLLLNILRGQPEKNLRHQVNYQASDGKYIPQRIKPLSRVIEQKIRTYCSIHDLGVVSIQCPFSNRSLRYQINFFLSKVEKKTPYVFYNILSSVNKSKIINTRIKKVQRCIKCNSYSIEPECPACRLVAQIISS
ncbi:MAG: ATP-binding protein [Candidatus Hodarchaeota archaeon]